MVSRNKAETPSEPPKPETLFIGIDQSYSGFGLVVLDEKGNCHQKSLLKWPPGKYKDDGERLLTIFNDLTKYFEIHNSSGAQIKIGMEGYAYGAKLGREKLGELGGTVKLASNLVFGITPETIAPPALKKAITGNGKASKQEMVSAIQQYDVEIKNDNLADAYGIAMMLYSS